MNKLRQHNARHTRRLAGRLRSSCALLTASAFLLTQMQFAYGAIDNTARAVSIFNGSGVVSNTSSQSIPVVAPNPQVAIQKSGVLNDDDGTPGLSVGDTITYTVEVTNPGNISLTGVNVTDPLVALTFQNGDTNNNFRLDPTETWIYQGQYTLTSFDLASNGGGDGDIDNTAQVTTNETPPANDSAEVPIDPNVSILVTKAGTLVDSDGTPGISAGDQIDYVINVTNNGVSDLTNIQLVDTLEQSGTQTNLVPVLTGGDTNNNGIIEAGETFTYQFSYVITQPNLDDGGDLVNTVSVTTDEIGPRTASDTQTLPAAIHSFTMTKLASLADLDGDNLGDAGETINYAFRFTNTGNRTLTNLAVTDPLPGLSAISCPGDLDNDGDIDILGVGASLDCTASVVIQSSDIGNGFVNNTATPTATRADGVTNVPEDNTANDNSTSTPLDRVVDLDVTKTGTLNDDDGTPGVSAGDTIDYVIEVSNAGTVPLTNITVNDPLIPGLTFISGDTNNDNQLDTTEVWRYEGSYTLIQNDIDTNGGGDGDIDNTVTADADETSSETAVEEVSIVTGVSIDVNKVAQLNDDDGTPGISAGDTIDYTITVENDGTTDLTNIVVQDILSQAGTNIVLNPVLVSGDLNNDNRINPGEIFNYQVTYTLTQLNLDTVGDLVNTVTVNTDQIGPNSDTAVTNLPSPTNNFTMTKIANLVDGDGDNLADAGETINYTFRFTNNGTAQLTNLGVTDPLPGLSAISCAGDGDNDGDIDSLNPSQTLDCTATYTVTAQDVVNGAVNNTATSSATQSDGTTPVIEDDSANDNSTSTPADSVVDVDFEKSVVSAVEILPNIVEIQYSLRVINNGNVPITNLNIDDDLVNSVSAPAQILGQGTITSTSGFSGTGAVNPFYDGIGNNVFFTGDVQVAVGATGEIRLTLVVDRRSTSLDTSNTAFLSSTELPGPVPSDDPNETPGIPDDDNPTPFDRPDDDNDGAPDDNESPLADRDTDGVPDQQDFDPTGYFYCEADGRILTGGSISVTNLGTGGTQTGLGSSNNITILRDGSDGQYQFYFTAPGTYRLTPILPAGGIASTTRLSNGNLDVTSLLPANPGVLGAGQVGNTGLLNDFSAAGNPFFTEFTVEFGDPIVFNNNIPLELCGTPSIALDKVVAAGPTIQPDDTNNVTFRLTATADGTERIENVTITDDLNSVFGIGNFQVLSTSIESAPATFGATVNPTYNGVSDLELLTPGGDLLAGESVSVLVELNVDVNPASFTNTGIAGATNALTGLPIPDATANAPIVILPNRAVSGVVATKTTRANSVAIGGIVPYTITFTNNNTVPVVDADIIDFMPPGFSYVLGTAVLNGVQVEPVQRDPRNIVFSNLDIAPGAEATLTLSLRLGAAVTGREFVNTTFLVDPLTNQRISNQAKAIVELEIESVFQCSHIIGRVFDDLDKDGYHDQGEPGLGGVRVVSVNGLLITTDKFGRYHITCDAIPADRIGSNYILKLDERTLPTGYRVTSENPRVVRVTQGKLAKINFAAANLRVVNVDLNDLSFKPGQTGLKRSALQDIALILPILSEEKSVLKIVYQASSTPTKLQKNRIKAVKRLIERAWKARDRDYSLEVETDIRRKSKSVRQTK